jgi:hypothetical protein
MPPGKGRATSETPENRTLRTLDQVKGTAIIEAALASPPRGHAAKELTEEVQGTTPRFAFRWPGHDLRPLPGAAAGTYHYGVLPPGLFRRARLRCLTAQRRRTTSR